MTSSNITGQYITSTTAKAFELTSLAPDGRSRRLSAAPLLESARSTRNPRPAGLARLHRFHRLSLSLLGLRQLEIPHDTDSDQHRSASIIEVRNSNLFRHRTSHEHRDHLRPRHQRHQATHHSSQ